jgi:hypothetical protein
LEGLRRLTFQGARSCFRLAAFRIYPNLLHTVEEQVPTCFDSGFLRGRFTVPKYFRAMFGGSVLRPER